MKARVLVVEDDAGMAQMLDAGLSKQGYDVTCMDSAEDAFQRLKTEEFDVVVTDLNMRGMNGIELCERIVANRPDVPVMVITAFGSLDTAISAIRAGAYDFINKPFEMKVLGIGIERAVQHRRLRDEVKRLRDRDLLEPDEFAGLLGESKAMRRLYDVMARVAPSDASVLITGESGTGKEVVGKALHQRSTRSTGPFVAVDCASLPETILESELFGHTSGAFTDAKSTRTGLFARADRGTLFLDEIGEMPIGLQPKLLRVLQERRIRPLGSDLEVPLDVRVIAATNLDLESAVDERRFRSDLYYRINVVPLHLPPLRARGNDILLLAQHFVERFASRSDRPILHLSPAAAEKLITYPWPGNVRELQNCLERAVALARFEEITVDDLPERIRDYSRHPVLVESDDPDQLLPLHEVERRYILRVLETSAYNKALAARILGLDRKTLYRKLRSYGTERDTYSKTLPIQ